MTIQQILTLILSTAALALSIFSLFLSRKWSHEAWQRDKRLPYYQELNEFLDDVREQYSDDTLHVHHRPDFTKFVSSARTLGLEDIRVHLEHMGRAVVMAEGAVRSNNLSGAASHVRILKERLEVVDDEVQRDINRLTKRRSFSSPGFRHRK